MNQEMPAPVARLTMITLGVSNMRAIEVGEDRRIHLPD